MDDVFSQASTLSLPTQAALAVSLLSIVYLTVSAVLSVLSIVVSILRRILGPLLPQPRPATPREDSSAALTMPTPARPPSQPSLKQLIKSSQKAGRGGANGPDRHADSELFLHTLRGHTDAVTGLSFTSDGKTLATACEDRYLRIFNLTSIDAKSIPFRQFHLRSGCQDVAFGSTADRVAILTKGAAGAAGMAFVDVSQKEVQVLNEMENIFTSRAAMGLCLKGSGGSGASGNIPVLVASAVSPELRVYSALPSLPALGKVDTGGMQHYGIAVSDDGRYVAAASFAADVKIYEIGYDRTGSFVGIKKVMDLKGHKKKITAVCFSPDGGKACSASEDGTLRIWNIAVRYKQQEDPKLLATEGLPSGKTSVTRLAWGRGGEIAAVAGSNVFLLSATSGQVVDAVYGAHNGTIVDVAWSPTRVTAPQGQATLLATAGEDGRVRLWRGTWNLV